MNAKLSLTLLVVVGAIGCCCGFDAAVREWRIAAENVGYHATTNGLAVRYPLDAKENSSNRRIVESSNGFLALANFAIRDMLGPWIPPYVGIRARRFACRVKPVSSDRNANPRLRFRYLPKWKDAEWAATEQSGWLGGLKTGEWAELSYPVGSASGERLSEVMFLFAEGACAFELAEPRLVLDDGTSYPLLNEDDPLYLTGMKEPVASAPIKPYPKRPTIKFGVGGHWSAVYGDGAAPLGAYMKKYLPEYDIVISLGGNLEPSAVPILAAAPDNVFWQVQGGQHGLRYAKLRNALVKDEQGREQDIPHNSTVATHPLFQRALEDRLAYLGSLGINSVQRYDYVWYYPKGLSGYDDASVAAFREDLEERDEGLLLAADGIRPERRIRFWDYYADYYGRRLAPADRGLGSWADYRPNCTTDAGKKLHLTLVTYEWLRLAQRFIAWAAKHCHGAPYDFLLNGEFTGDGNDHVYLARLKGVGLCAPEFFIDTAKDLDAVYHASGRYLRVAKACGSPFGITVETSRGGGGSQPYWSPRTGYALCYLLSALGYDGFEYDGLLGPMSWQEYVDPANAFNAMELALGMADARGYRQARLDGTKPRRQSGVYHLVERPVAGTTRRLFMAGTAHPDQRKGNPNDFRSDLQVEGVDYEATDPQEILDLLPTARTIFMALDTPRPDIEEKVIAWAAEPGHLLATNRADFAAVAAGLPHIQKPAPAERAADLATFDCVVGSVAVMLNRQVAITADRDAWYEKVWRPVVYKRTGDWSKILFHDKCPGADVAAEVPVAESCPYRVYRFLKDEERVVEPQGGFLKLELGDDFADVVYYGPDTPAFRDFLEKVRAERVLTGDFIGK